MFSRLSFYLLYGIFFGLSLFPFRVLYALADFFAVILHRVVRYRKAIVYGNIRRSFPEKTPAEVESIATAFYTNFCDTWIETVKMLTISDREIKQRMTFDFSVYDSIKDSGRPASALIGHVFNWEYFNLAISKFQSLPMLSVYMPLTNVAMDELFKKIRGRFGNYLLPATELTQRIIPWRKKQYVIGLVADQSPATPTNAQWLYFLNQPTAFVTGPERNAQVLGQVVTFLTIEKPKRGYYHFSVKKIEPENGNSFLKGEVTRKFAAFVETEVRKAPDNYLWSHKRWKHPWRSDYASLWIDKEQLPSPTE